MKVISEYTIKKLIQTKLLENYKKKLLTEDVDTASTDFKNQIISSGIIEALWLFFNDSKYENKLGILKNLKENMSNRFDEILSSQSLTNFKSKINNLINEFINLLKTNPAFATLLSSHPLFTNLLAYNDIILERFNKKLTNIKIANAYTRYNDINIISNHISGGITYEGAKVFNTGIGGIKDNILEILDELLDKSPQTLTIEQVQQKIKGLLPVLDANDSANTTTDSVQKKESDNLQNVTPQEIKKTGFAELKDKLNLSSRQLQKLNRTITKIANRRTNSEENSKKYQALLIALTLKQATGIQKPTDSTENVKTAINDSEHILIKTLQSQQKTFDSCYVNFKSELTDGTETDGNKEILYNWLTYVISNTSALNSENEVIFSFQPKNMATEFVKHLTLQIDRILINSKESILLEKSIQTAANNFFQRINNTKNDDVNNNNLSNEFKLFKQWINSYFENAWIENKKLILDYNFINYIQLKFLESKKIESAVVALKNFKVGGKNKIEEMSGEATTSENFKSTTKECFKNDNNHTDNFKLPALKVLTEKYYQEMANYLLNNSAPKDFGFINKNDEKKAAYAQKLKDEGLNVDKIAKALEILYPKAGDYKTPGNQEKWIANYFLNINADEIIATANDTSTSDAETDTATTKECFKENNDNHTDNFKLYSALSAGVKTSDEYRIKIAEYLLNNSAPKDFGFINKNDEKKAAYAQKLKDEGLNVDKIAKALKEIYPKSDYFPKKGQKNPQAWIGNFFININVNEIIAFAKKMP